MIIDISENIKIRPLLSEDYQYVLNWSEDEKFCSANGWEINRDVQELHRWWLNLVNNKSEDFLRLGIDFSGKLVGYVDLACIKNHTAELGIAIGDSTLWGKGVGTIASEKMIRYGFEKLGVKVFNAETHESNIRSTKMLQKLGFKEISRVGKEEYLGVETRLIQFELSLE